MNYSILQNILGVALLAGVVTAAVAFMDPSAPATQSPVADAAAVVQPTTIVAAPVTADSVQP
ncbi:MAG TPA: hypothetical protein PLV87_04990 [Opitutaceae bacterium]|nr:hypothetical protein [Opitutaceae bacterium]